MATFTEYTLGTTYTYPDSSVFQNRADIRDSDDLNALEQSLSAYRFHIKMPTTDVLNQDHFKLIHKHLFQDLYDWAGEYRAVDIRDGRSGKEFASHLEIEQKMEGLFHQLSEQDFLRGADPAEFTANLAKLACELNSIQPFMGGTDRVSRTFLTQLAQNAGNDIAWSNVKLVEWVEALTAGQEGDFARMEELMQQHLVFNQEAIETPSVLSISTILSLKEIREKHPDLQLQEPASPSSRTNEGHSHLFDQGTGISADSLLRQGVASLRERQGVSESAEDRAGPVAPGLH